MTGTIGAPTLGTTRTITIIREGRSKGIVVFFASQSPNDYQQKFFNFQELLEFAYIFQCEGISASSIQDILGCSTKTAKGLQIEGARLEPWQVISRSQEKTEEFTKFTAEAFLPETIKFKLSI
jgi:ribosomal protein L30E